MHSTTNNTIKVENLTKYYGDLLAVDHINFEVRQGEVFGFLGPNGAGKTTTQRMLTTLLEPSEGRMVINGHDLARDAYPVKRQMGLVPEEANVYTGPNGRSGRGNYWRLSASGKSETSRQRISPRGCGAA